MRRFILAFFIISCALFGKSVVLFDTFTEGVTPEQEYLAYAVTDIVRKDITLFSYRNDIPPHASDVKDYDYVKRNANAIAKRYNAGIVVAATVSFADGRCALTYFIYDRARPTHWRERTLYANEASFHTAIRSFLRDFYTATQSTRDATVPDSYLSADVYRPLIGYYKDVARVRSLYQGNEKMITLKMKEAFDVFYEFYKDNLYVNLDYYEYLLDSRDTSVTSGLFASLKECLGDTHHYLYYLLAQRHFHLYRKYVYQSDIEESLAYISEAIARRSTFHRYHFFLAKVFLMKGDYISAQYSFEKCVAIHPYHVASYRALISLFKKKALRTYNDVMIAYAEKILDVEPQNTYALEEIAQLYEDKHDWQNALHYNTCYYEALKVKARSLAQAGYSESRQLRETRGKMNALHDRIASLKEIVERN